MRCWIRGFLDIDDTGWIEKEEEVEGGEQRCLAVFGLDLSGFLLLPFLFSFLSFHSSHRGFSLTLISGVSPVYIYRVERSMHHEEFLGSGLGAGFNWGYHGNSFGVVSKGMRCRRWKCTSSDGIIPA